MQVVAEGMVSLKELNDGTIDLADVALASDFLACRADNEDILRQRREEE
jgi:hypothetical protein